MSLLLISYQNYKIILLAKCKLQREKYADKLFYQANIFEEVKSTKRYARTFLPVLHHAKQTPPSLCVLEQEQSTAWQHSAVLLPSHCPTAMLTGCRAPAEGQMPWHTSLEAHKVLIACHCFGFQILFS